MRHIGLVTRAPCDDPADLPRAPVGEISDALLPCCCCVASCYSTRVLGSTSSVQQWLLGDGNVRARGRNGTGRPERRIRAHCYELLV